jgi:hypothetical protein
VRADGIVALSPLLEQRGAWYRYRTLSALTHSSRKLPLRLVEAVLPGLAQIDACRFDAAGQPPQDGPRCDSGVLSDRSTRGAVHDHYAREELDDRRRSMCPRHVGRERLPRVLGLLYLPPSTFGGPAAKLRTESRELRMPRASSRVAPVFATRPAPGDRRCVRFGRMRRFYNADAVPKRVLLTTRAGLGPRPSCDLTDGGGNAGSIV